MKRSDVIIAVLLFGFAAAGLVVLNLWYGTAAHGLARRAHFTSDSREVVIADDQAGTRAPAHRVRVHDTRSGKELARVRLSAGSQDSLSRATRFDCFDCIPAAGGRLWCCDRSGDDGLSLRSLDTLAVVAGEKRLHQLAPALAQGVSMSVGISPDQVPMVDLEDGALLVLAKDGRRYRIGADLSARVEEPRHFDVNEPSTLVTLHPEDLRLPANAVSFESASGLTSSVRLPEGKLRLVQRGRGERWRLGVESRTRSASDQSFLDAGFLADPDREQAVILASPPSAVLAHVELAGSSRQLVLSRIDGNGALGWSCTVADDKVRGARLIGDLLVVVLRGSMLGLDEATGAIRYQQAF